MNKERRRKLRRQKNKERRDKPVKLTIGSWDVEYECGLHVLVEPTHQDKIESKVSSMKHACARRSCRAWRYIRITEDNADKFGWEGENGGRLDSNSGKLARNADQVRA